MFIVDWWNSLSIAAQVFACMALPATLILLIQTVLMFIGIGGESVGMESSIDDISDATPDDIPEAGDGIFGEDSISDTVDHAGGLGLRIFTLRGIIAFFVVFGWVGILMDSSGVKLWITVLVSTLCGLCMMIALAVLLKAIMRLRSNGNNDNRNAIGHAGRVYLTIPPSRSGEGKVQLMLQGSYVERNAVTDEAEPIPTGSEIVVVGVSGDTSLIVKRK